MSILNNEEQKAGQGTVLADNSEAYKPIAKWQQPEEAKAETTTIVEKPAATESQRYKTFQEAIDANKRMAEEAKKRLPSDEDIKKIEKANKRRMLLSGIADAANVFHQAYSYSRGIKPMTENKSYSDAERKRQKDDWSEVDKKRERVLSFLDKAAEYEKALAGMKNKDELMEYRNAELLRKSKRDEWSKLVAEGKLEVDRERAIISRMLTEGRITQMQHDMLMDELNYSLDKNKSGGYTTSREVVYNDDGKAVSVIESKTPVGSSAAAQAGSNKTPQGKKQLPQGKKQLP